MNTPAPFSKEIIATTISKLTDISRSPSTDNEKEEKIHFCISVLKIMYESNDVLASVCPYYYEISRETFENILPSINNGLMNFNDKFFIVCYRFLVELSLYLKRTRKSDTDVTNLLSRAGKSVVSEENKFYFDYAKSDEFKIEIINNYMGKKDFQAFLNYEKHVEEIKKQLEISLSEVDRAKEEASRIAKILEEQKMTGSFVELEKGFSLMLDRVTNAKKWTFGWLLAISAIIIAIPTVRIFYPMAISDASIWEKLVPLIGVELILIYFFRVTLKHYYSLQTQIMQLDFRYSLCQFIGAYSEYSRKIKEANGNALDKFESLIFSNLLSESDNIPSTFDGLDNLASLINNMRGK